jgi:phosphate-selective porin
MKAFKSIRLFSAAVASFAAVASAQANNQTLIDTLVKKGYLTQEEAQQMAGATLPVTQKSDRQNQSFTVGGVVHTQLMHTNYSVSNPSTAPGNVTNKPGRTSNPSVRRAELSFEGKLNDKWGASLALGNSDGNEKDSDSYMQVGCAIIHYTHSDALRVSAGYSLAHFGLENTTSSKTIKTIERSAAARYFDNALSFGSTNVGVFAEGKLVNGVYYSGSITRADGNASNGGSPTTKTNVPVLTGRLGYMGEHNGFSYNVGSSLTYLKGVGEALIANQQNQAMGWELFGTFGYQDFTLATNFLLGSVKNGREATPAGANPVANPATYKNARPMGISLIPSYKFCDGKYEIAALYSYVKTDNLRVKDSNGTINTGVASSKIDRGTTDLTYTPVGGAQTTVYFNKITQMGLFGSWYIMENDVKLTAGYTYTQFKDSTEANHLKTKLATHTVGARLQLLF